MDHWIEGNMTFILNKTNFSNSYVLSHGFLSSFHTHAFAVLQLWRPGQMGIRLVWPGLLAVTRGSNDAGYQVLIMSFGLFLTGNDAAYLCCIYVRFGQRMPRVMLSHIIYLWFHVCGTVSHSTSACQLLSVINILSWILWLHLITSFAAGVPFFLLLLCCFNLRCSTFVVLVY